jgi:hypothetical protein
MKKRILEYQHFLSGGPTPEAKRLIVTTRGQGLAVR